MPVAGTACEYINLHPGCHSMSASLVYFRITLQGMKELIQQGRCLSVRPQCFWVGRVSENNLDNTANAN